MEIIIKKASEIETILKKIRFVVFDFDGVFTNNKVIVSEDGKESVICSRSDGFGIRLLEELNIESMILSTENNQVVSKRAEKLNIKCIQGISNKIDVLRECAIERNVSLEQVSYLGNDVNDVQCLSEVGCPVIVADAHSSIFAYSKITLERNGGEGAVREFCELIYKTQKEINGEIDWKRDFFE